MMSKFSISLVLMVLLSLTGTSKALAQASYKGIDTGKPYYIEGQIVGVRWVDPYIEIETNVSPGYSLPKDLASLDVKRSGPIQVQIPDGLTPAEVGRRQNVWRITLSGATQAEKVGLTRNLLQPGRRIAAIGYAGCTLEQLDFRADIVIVDRKGYQMRMANLPKSNCNR